MAKHIVSQVHHIQFDNTMALTQLPYYTSRVSHEAIEFSLYHNFHREWGSQMIPAWKTKKCSYVGSREKTIAIYNPQASYQSQKQLNQIHSLIPPTPV
jgi:hypothetical protein